MTRRNIENTELLQYAVIGYEHRLAQIQKAMQDIHRQLQGRGYADTRELVAPPAAATNNGGSAHPRSRISPEGLANIRAGAKKRWARARKEQGRA